MAQDTPIHDYLLPRLTALVADAIAQGFARDVVVAVVIDLITAPGFDTAAPDPKADSAPHADFDRSDPPPTEAITGAQPMDYPKPFDWFRD